jgi:WD40 repeat protein
MNFCPENGYLYSVEWSPFRPCVFACGTHKGNLLIYDLNESGENHCQVKQASSDGPIYTVSFNQQRAEYLATGDRAGVVKIWQLSQALTKFDSSELNKLNDISEKPFKNN